MSHGDYYDPSNKIVYDGDTANAADLNAINSAVDAALETVATDLDTLEGQINPSNADSEAWAVDPQGTNPDALQPTKYSSEANATEAKEWASSEDNLIDKADGTQEAVKSSKEHATDSETSATASGVSESAAAASAASAAADALIAQGQNTISSQSPVEVNTTGSGPYDFEVVLENDVAAEIDEIDTDDTLVADSDIKIPTQAAVKGYVDTQDAVERAYGDATFEPLFSKNTAFNKDFGALATDVAQGNRGILSGGTADQVLVKQDGTDYNVAWGIKPETPTMILTHEEATGVEGGDISSSNVWLTAPLNNVEFNGIPGASLSTNQITLPAGTYEIIVLSIAFINIYANRVYDTTNSVELTRGCNHEPASTSPPNTPMDADGRFTLLGTAVIELQAFPNANNSVDGWGAAINLVGLIEKYRHVTIKKVA